MGDRSENKGNSTRSAFVVFARLLTDSSQAYLIAVAVGRWADSRGAGRGEELGAQGRRAGRTGHTPPHPAVSHLGSVRGMRSRKWDGGVQGTHGRESWHDQHT